MSGKTDLPVALAIVNYASARGRLIDSFMVYFGAEVPPSAVRSAKAFFEANHSATDVAISWEEPYLCLTVVVDTPQKREQMARKLEELFRPKYQHTLIVKVRQYRESGFLVATGFHVEVRGDESAFGRLAEGQLARLRVIDGIQAAEVTGIGHLRLSARVARDTEIAAICSQVEICLFMLVEPAIRLAVDDTERLIAPQPA